MPTVITSKKTEPLVIDPSELPIDKDDIYLHRDNPGLVRKFIIGLPHGLSLFYLCSVVLGCDDLDPFVHGTLCDFLVNPKYGRYRDATVPRSFFKTTIGTVGMSIWLPIRRDRNIKILVAMNTSDNAEKRINTIRNHWQTNSLLQNAFPELVPDVRKVRWSNQCCELARTKHSDEGTYESIGSGGAVVSRHYDYIIEDDLIYAKKDDMRGAEIMPNQDDIDKAIGWHKLVYSLFSNPARSSILNIGTRWGTHDLKNWIKENEADKYTFFSLKAESDIPNPEWPGHGESIWPTRFGTPELKDICASQGSAIYATQYLNMPRDASDIVFEKEWIQWFDGVDSVPKESKYLTVVDLASGWADQNKGRGLCNNVVATYAMDTKGRVYICRYDAGKYNPDKVIDLMITHHQQFPQTSLRIEEVQYQRAIRFYANKRMNETGYRYQIIPLESDIRSNAKDARIRAIANIASTGGLFVKKGMKLFLEEFCDYPNGRTCDILDTLGHALMILRPKIVANEETKKDENPFILENIIEDILKNSSSHGKYPFNIQCTNDPFSGLGESRKRF